jgi:FkbM family methyltransferase
MSDEQNMNIDLKKNMEKLEELIRESAYFANMAKNSNAVPTGENEILTRIFTGQLMYVDPRDLSVSPHLIMSGEWEMGITKIFRQCINKDSVVFDVGANSGYFGVVAGSNIKNGSIHLFEANPHYYPLIDKCLWVNGLRQISKINQLAVSSKDDELVKLKIVDNLWGSSSLHSLSPDIKIKEEIQVQTVSLDTYAANNNITKVDIVKIDVEGHEEEVFRGMTNIIEQNPQIKIFMEYTIDAYSTNFFNDLKAKFPNIFAIVDEDICLVNSEDELSKINNEWVMLLLTNDVTKT